jgi:predicted transcriptional regulator
MVNKYNLDKIDIGDLMPVQMFDSYLRKPNISRLFLMLNVLKNKHNKNHINIKDMTKMLKVQRSTIYKYTDILQEHGIIKKIPGPNGKTVNFSINEDVNQEEYIRIAMEMMNNGFRV